MATDYQRQTLADSLFKRLRLHSVWQEILVDHELPPGSFRMTGHAFHHNGRLVCPILMSGTADRFEILADDDSITHKGPACQIVTNATFVQGDLVMLDYFGLDMRICGSLLDRILANLPEAPPRSFLERITLSLGAQS